MVIKKEAKTFIYSKTFVFKENSQDLQITLQPFCNDFLAEGQPISLSLELPYEFNLGTLVLYLDFDDDSLIDSTKLESGDLYPSDKLEFYVTSDGRLKSNLTGFYPNVPKSVILPLPIQSTSTTMKITGSIELSLGSSFVKVFNAEGSFTYSSTEIDFDTEDEKDVVSGASDSVTFKLDPDDYDLGSKTSEVARYLFILPKGFSFSNSGLAGIPGAYPDPSYSIALATKTIFESQENSFSLAVKVPWLESSEGQSLLFAVAVGSEFSDQSCYYSGKRSYSITAQKLVQSKFSPKESTAYSFGSTTALLEISFSFTGSIYEGSVISFELGSQWQKLNKVVSAKVLFGNEEISGEYSHSEWTSDKTLKAYTGGFIIRAVATLPVVSKQQQKSFEKFKGFEWVRVYYKTDVGSWISFQWAQSSDDLNHEVYTKFTYGNTAALASDAVISVFPDILNTYYAFLAVEFLAPFDIPKNSIISIIADFSQDEDLTLNTWCNFEVDSISLEGSNLTIIPSSPIPSSYKIKILKDNALTLLSPGFNEVYIVLEIDGNNVIDDQIKSSSKSGFQVYQTPRNKITSFSITPSIANSGYESLCRITLSITSEIAEKVLIHIKTNKEYNALAGPVYYSPDFPESAYLEGFIESTQKPIKCLTEHWVITCDAGMMFYQKTTGTFSIYLKNPKDVSYFSVYVTNYSNYHLTSPYRQSKYLPDSLTNSFTDHINLPYKSVQITQSGQTQTVLIEANLDMNLTSLSTLFITIPKPYDLVLSAKSLGNCSITYHTGKSIYNNPCEVDHSRVVFSLDKSISSSFILSPEYITTFKVAGLASPWNSLTKPKYIYENLKFNSYSLQFLISKAEKLSSSGFPESTIEFESFLNINSAFSGFYFNDLEELVVNEGEPLVVVPGSFTGMFSVGTKDKVLHAQSVKLKGTIRKGRSSERLSLRPDSLELKLDLPSQGFMAGCDSSVTLGFYYIDWEIEEDPFYPYHLYYRAPRPTLIEVNDDIEVKVEFVDEIIVQNSSFMYEYPLKIVYKDKVLNPFKYFEVLFYHEYKDLNISFYPEYIEFNNQDNAQLLGIMCENCKDGVIYNFEANIQGYVSSAFTLSDQFSFTFVSADPVGLNLTVDVDDVTSNSFVASINSDKQGKVNWYLVGQDNLNKSFNLESKNSEINTENSFTFDEQMSEYIDQINTIRQESLNYEDFSHKVSILGRSLYFYGWDIISPDKQKTLKFTQLIPDTTYTLFITGLNGNSSAAVQAIKTGSYPPHGIVSFEDYIPDQFLLRKILKLFKIEPERVKFTESVSRNLQQGQNCLILSSITSEVSGYDIVSSFSKSEMSQELGVTVTGIGKISQDMFEPAGWEAGPEWILELDYVVINFTSSVDGSVVCGVERSDHESNFSISSEQVRNGESSLGTDNFNRTYRMQVMKGFDSSILINFTDYELDVYQISCVTCNLYPVMPGCSEVKSKEYDRFALDDSYGRILVACLLWNLV